MSRNTKEKLSTLDIEAIKARVEKMLRPIRGPSAQTQYANTVDRLAHDDVPALLAEVERLTVERDEAVAWQNAKAEWIEVATRTLEANVASIDSLKAERDAARLDLEAAQSFTFYGPKGTFSASPHLDRPPMWFVQKNRIGTIVKRSLTRDEALRHARELAGEGGGEE